MITYKQYYLSGNWLFLIHRKKSYINLRDFKRVVSPKVYGILKFEVENYFNPVQRNSYFFGNPYYNYNNMLNQFDDADLIEVGKFTDKRTNRV